MRTARNLRPWIALFSALTSLVVSGCGGGNSPRRADPVSAIQRQQRSLDMALMLGRTEAFEAFYSDSFRENHGLSFDYMRASLIMPGDAGGSVRIYTLRENYVVDAGGGSVSQTISQRWVFRDAETGEEERADVTLEATWAKEGATWRIVDTEYMDISFEQEGANEPSDFYYTLRATRAR